MPNLSKNFIEFINSIKHSGLSLQLFRKHLLDYHGLSHDNPKVQYIDSELTEQCNAFGTSIGLPC